MTNHAFSVKNLYYVTQNKRQIFQNLSLVAQKNEKCGIIGRNGVGKSTLLKLLAQEIEPSSGDIEIHTSVSYVPQILIFKEEETIAHFFEIEKVIENIEKSEKGLLTEEDLIFMENKWDLPERIFKEFSLLGLNHLSFSRNLKSLSGGEKRRLSLCKAGLFEKNFLLLDEPSNDLDREGKNFLKKFLTHYNNGFLMVSHDRELLGTVHSLCEILEQGITIYGGNYSYYLEQKEIQNKAFEQDFLQRKKEVSSFEKESENHLKAQKQSHIKAQMELKDQGNATFARGGKAKRELPQRKAQVSLALKEKCFEQKREELANLLMKAKERLRKENHVEIPLPQVFIEDDFLSLHCENLYFGYEKPLLEDFYFEARGPVRVGLFGKNGSGKSTLLHLFAQKILPQKGICQNYSLDSCLYLSQEQNFLDESLSLIENIRLSSLLSEEEAVATLKAHHFSLTMAQRAVSTLSGGERIRGALACLLSQEKVPQMLLLDEPTNNLDIASLEKLESALLQYRGVLVVATHDEIFAQNIGIENKIMLSC